MFVILCITVFFGIINGCPDVHVANCKSCNNITVTPGYPPVDFIERNDYGNCSFVIVVCFNYMRITANGMKDTLADTAPETGVANTEIYCNDNGQWIGNGSVVVSSVECSASQ